jgi:TctA family transporter
MDLIANLSLGFGEAFTAANLIYALVGCLLGTLIGVLPGIGPTATIAMLLPATYALPPVAALIMLAGIYYGSQYGGSTTAILVNLPGEASSVVTALDGHQMAKKGRAGAALATAGLGSFFAGCVGTLMIAAFAPGADRGGLPVWTGRILLPDGAGPHWRRGAGLGLAAQSHRYGLIGPAAGPGGHRRQLGRGALCL